MKKLFVIVIKVSLPFLISAQQAADSAALIKRLDIYITHSKNLDYEKVMDYIHPSLFKIATREQMVKAMKEAYNMEELKIAFDSMAISSVSPGFGHANTEYRKVQYYSVMSIQFTDKEELDSGMVKLMVESLKEDFSAQEVDYKKSERKFIVKGYDLLVAIRDPGTEWMFLGVDNDPLIEKLFPREVINHFKLY